MSNQTAIVTGASRGIGRGIAIALSERGFNVAINYNASSDAAEQTKILVDQAGGCGMIVQANVAEAEDRQRLLDATITEFGDVHVLVNNAGISVKSRGDLLDATEESFDHLINVNLKGPHFLTQLVAKHMIDRNDDDPRYIINVNSISAYASSPNRGEYCISKAGLAMCTKIWADHLADSGILVYEVRPGVIATDMTSGVTEKYDKLILEDGITPIRRWGRPDDVAKAVIAITDDLLPFSTGEVINVDGGFHLRRL